MQCERTVRSLRSFAGRQPEVLSAPKPKEAQVAWRFAWESDSPHARGLGVSRSRRCPLGNVRAKPKEGREFWVAPLQLDTKPNCWPTWCAQVEMWMECMLPVRTHRKCHTNMLQVKIPGHNSLPPLPLLECESQGLHRRFLGETP